MNFCLRKGSLIFLKAKLNLDESDKGYKRILKIFIHLQKGILEHGIDFPMKNAVKNLFMEIIKLEKLAEFEELFSMDFKEF